MHVLILARRYVVSWAKRKRQVFRFSCWYRYFVAFFVCISLKMVLKVCQVTVLCSTLSFVRQNQIGFFVFVELANTRICTVMMTLICIRVFCNMKPSSPSRRFWKLDFWFLIRFACWRWLRPFLCIMEQTIVLKSIPDQWLTTVIFSFGDWWLWKNIDSCFMLLVALLWRFLCSL